MPTLRRAVKPEEIEHLVVYRKDDEYAGCPFNGGVRHIAATIFEVPY